MKDGAVAVIEIDNQPIKIGDEVFLKFNSRYRKSKIVSIEENKNPVAEAASGRIGIQLDHKITMTTKIWKKPLD